MGTDSALRRVVISAVARACNRPVESVSPESRLDELDVDSLGIASVISDVENAFSKQVDPNSLLALLHLETVEDIIRALEQSGFVDSHACT